MSVSLTERAQARAVERVRARRRVKALAALVLVVLAAVAAGVGWLLLGSRVLAVDQVRVTGTSRLSVAEVAAAADVAAGTPLAGLDTEAVRRRVAALAPVRSVKVVRDWPQGVLIRVRERAPAAAQPSGTSWSLVDRTGITFATVERRPRGLPVVSAPVDQGPAALRATLDVLDVLPPAVRAQVRQVRASSVESVSLRLTRGRTVVWGGTERGERKAAVLAVLLTRSGAVYDVSAPDTPTTRR